MDDSCSQELNPLYRKQLTQGIFFIFRETFIVIEGLYYKQIWDPNIVAQSKTLVIFW